MATIAGAPTSEGNEAAEGDNVGNTSLPTESRQLEESGLPLAGVVSAPAEQDDGALFHTVSSPQKPAGSVFRAAGESSAEGFASASDEGTGMPSPAPSRPAEEPAPRASAGPRVEQKSSEATGPPPEFTVKVRHRKTLRTKLDVVRAAVADPSVCDVVQRSPREISMIGKREGFTLVTFWFRAESHRPVTCMVRVTPNPDLQQVVFHVEIAEFQARSTAASDRVQASGAFAGGRLLAAMSQAEASGNPIVLGDLDAADVDSGLRSLEEEDVLRVLSRPRLLTTSGRPATVVTGSPPADSAAAPAEDRSTAANDLRTALTLLPVVTESGDIELEVVSELQRTGTAAEGEERLALRAREIATKVRLRPGQTLVIGGPCDDVKKGPPRGLLPALAQKLNLVQADDSPAKRVVLITPQLAGPARSDRPASVASRDRSDPHRATTPALR